MRCGPLSHRSIPPRYQRNSTSCRGKTEAFRVPSHFCERNRPHRGGRDHALTKCGATRPQRGCSACQPHFPSRLAIVTFLSTGLCQHQEPGFQVRRALYANVRSGPAPRPGGGPSGNSRRCEAAWLQPRRPAACCEHANHAEQPVAGSWPLMMPSSEIQADSPTSGHPHTSVRTRFPFTQMARLLVRGTSRSGWWERRHAGSSGFGCKRRVALARADGARSRAPSPIPPPPHSQIALENRRKRCA